jgi:hypothetical protein
MRPGKTRENRRGHTPGEAQSKEETEGKTEMGRDRGEETEASMTVDYQYLKKIQYLTAELGTTSVVR